ncbi:hypothetical protein NC652_009144 [Populus alba x Populus x berolinensis]|nr:hypothetical protein NC652_009144 [Populus alba x Populus x berolinensis]
MELQLVVGSSVCPFQPTSISFASSNQLIHCHFFFYVPH